MATYVERRGLADEAEPLGLLTEGAAGIATIVLAIVALAGVAAGSLASIAAIVVGVGLMVQAFNSAAEESKMMAANSQSAQFGGEVMADCLCGLAEIVLGILALVGASAAHLLPAALIVFGGDLLLSGAISAAEIIPHGHFNGPDASRLLSGFVFGRRDGDPDRARRDHLGDSRADPCRVMGSAAGRLYRDRGRAAAGQRDLQRRRGAAFHDRLITQRGPSLSAPRGGEGEGKSDDEGAR